MAATARKTKARRSSGGRGDLYAGVRIVLPEGKDARLEELMRQWREQKPYDPRKDMA